MIFLRTTHQFFQVPRARASLLLINNSAIQTRVNKDEKYMENLFLLSNKTFLEKPHYRSNLLIRKR